MQPEDIGAAYNRITHLWTSPKFNRSNGVAQHERAIAFTAQRGPALDVGCGCTGRFFELLSNHGFTPEGIDVSAEMLRLSKTHYPHITTYHADICTWQPPKRYDFITAWDSIWHIPLEQQVPVLTKLLDHLNPGGVFIFSAGGTDDENEHVDNFMGPEVYYSSIGIPGFLEVITATGGICKHLEFDQYPELHLYFIVQKKPKD